MNQIWLYVNICGTKYRYTGVDHIILFYFLLGFKMFFTIYFQYSQVATSQELPSQPEGS